MEVSASGQEGGSAAKMDAIYRRQRFIYDATRRYYLLGRDRLIAGLQPPVKGAVLEIGCGTARNLIRCAKRYPGVQLYGLDVSEAMLESARASVARRGLTPRILLCQGDATAFDPRQLYGRENFDRVFVSYSLSMIPGWQEALRHAATLLAPNGELHLVDFGDFARYPALVRRVQLAWLRHFSVVPIPQMHVEIGKVAAEIGLTPATEILYGGYAIHMRLRHRRL